MVLLVVPILVSLAAFVAFDRQFAGVSLWSLSNLVGPTAETFHRGAGLTACTELMGTPGNPICFHAGRMPLPSMIVAAGVELLGNRFLSVAFFKLILCLLPLLGSLFVAWRRLPASRSRRLLIVVLLLMPLAMTPLLADLVNLQVEEGYFYGFIALAVSILFFGFEGSEMDRHLSSTKNAGFRAGRAVIFALCVDAIYLTKSSMSLVVLVLTIFFLIQERRSRLRVLVLFFVASAPVGWALHQHHASGRYTFGTSIDGINLHKGNNAELLDRYPPAAGSSLDSFDMELNHGLSFPGEWSFNDFHSHAAFQYIASHPEATLDGDLRKLAVIFLTVQKIGSSGSHGTLLAFETAGLVAFRFILWAAILCSLYGLRWLRAASPTRRHWGLCGIIFLSLIAACALPYVIGFAYTRHVSVLIYPSVLMCCAVLAGPPAPHRTATED